MAIKELSACVKGDQSTDHYKKNLNTGKEARAIEAKMWIKSG